jgi:hypothetical protein
VTARLRSRAWSLGWVVSVWDAASWEGVLQNSDFFREIGILGSRRSPHGLCPGEGLLASEVDGEGVGTGILGGTHPEFRF